ncbi:MAG: CHAD domain-containing protein [Planctomycetota bacterium]|nr:CHAD domain-containing protein [Planctomycetota bacterium]
MSYRIKHTESETGALRRVLTEQFEKALAAFDDDSVDPHEAIHDCRKRLKKCRAALRLFRSALGDAYAEESTALRDAARRVSAVRDAQALIECFDALEHHFEAQIDETAAAVARQALLDRRAAAEDNFNLPERIDRLRADIESARDRAQSLALSEAGFDAIGPNIKRTDRRGRKAMRAAEENPTAENFHEWRKRAKYHWAHIRLLQDLWPRAREARRE